jgi:hypothetical protein
LVAPITHPVDKKLNLADEMVWLPEGKRWTDIFNGRIYSGGLFINMFRDLDSIPVLAPEGAIVPMYRNADTNNLSLDQPLEIHLWRGNGEYELYEDDGETMAYKNGAFVKTHFKLEEDGTNLTLTITPPVDSKGLLPTERKMYLCFRDVKAAAAPIDFSIKKAEDGLGIELEITVGSEPVTVRLMDVIPRENENFEEHKNAILTRYQGSNDLKSVIFKNKLPRKVMNAIEELDPILFDEDV